VDGFAEGLRQSGRPLRELSQENGESVGRVQTVVLPDLLVEEGLDQRVVGPAAQEDGR